MVASDHRKPLLNNHLEAVEQCLTVKVIGNHWLSPGKSADIQLASSPGSVSRMALEMMLAQDKIDFFIVPNDGKRQKKLLLADMDNTMVVGEILDELAAQHGLGEKIAAITDLAMRGELDFQAALQTRVAMLKDLSEEALQRTLASIQPTPGAEMLVKTMRGQGAGCVLVSGGFNYFSDPIAAKLGFHFSHGNILEIRKGRLTGKVIEPILDHQSKLTLLQHYQKIYGLDSSETLAVGDGANDLAMISAAGLGVGYHPKQFLKERIENNILYGDLTTLLYAQGYENF